MYQPFLLLPGTNSSLFALGQRQNSDSPISCGPALPWAVFDKKSAARVEGAKVSPAWLRKAESSPGWLRFRTIQTLLFSTCAPKSDACVVEEVKRCNVAQIMSPSTVRVLVVDDYEPFRRFVCLTLGKRPALQIVGEVSDGLEAVRRAEELKPDLILLDIGLPTLNGIEAARQIRNLAPESKVIFLSQESSPHVVQEALSVGAWGYVVKARAGSDLLAAVDAVLLEKHFVSST